MKKIWEDAAWAEYVYWQTEDRKTLRKINSLLKEIERVSDKPPGKAEMLKGNLLGCMSIRIDKKNRIVYRILGGKDTEPFLQIVECGGHYGDR